MRDNEHQGQLPLLITMFNHKGGIGKTTASQNIGYILSTLGKKVLLVDADPQASLTSLIFAGEWENSEGNAQQEFYETCKRDRIENNIYRSVADIFYPTIDSGTGMAGTPLERADHIMPTQVHNYPNLFLIPGHLDVALLDSPAELGLTGALHFYNNVPKSFTDIFRRFGAHNGFDIILFDLAPSVGAWNRSIIMLSDGLCVPFFPDYLSFQAVKNLFRQISGSWLTEFQQLGDKLKLSKDKIRPPVFLGAYPQRVKGSIRGTSEEAPRFRLTQSYEFWIRKTYNFIGRSVEGLKLQGLVSENFHAFRTAGIADFLSLGLDVQGSGRPISDLDYEHKHPNENGTKRNLNKGEKRRQYTAESAYRKVVGALLRNVRLEHREALGDEFMQKIDLSAVTIENIERTEIFDVIDDSPLRDDIANNQFYTDQQLSFLLTHYIQPRDNGPHQVLDPIQGDGAFASRGQLTQILIDRYKLLQDAGRNEIVLFVPLNLGENHWVLLVLDNKKNNKCDAWYYDPLGRLMSALLERSLLEIAHEVKRTIDINQTGDHNQQDGFNCGPWVVEFARFLVIPRYRFPPADINAKRVEHAVVLNESQRPEIVADQAVITSRPKKRISLARRPSLVPNPISFFAENNTPERNDELRAVRQRTGKKPTKDNSTPPRPSGP